MDSNTAPMPEKITIGDKYGPAMEITDPDEARQYLAWCVEHALRCRPGLSASEALRIERQSLGYYSGYYDAETGARVARLFNAVHPIFGSLASGGPSPEEAFALGQEAGEKAKGGVS